MDKMIPNMKKCLKILTNVLENWAKPKKCRFGIDNFCI